MRKSAFWIAGLSFFAACSQRPQSLRQDVAWDPRSLRVGDRPAEAAVLDAVEAQDPSLRDRRLHGAHYLSAPDARGGGYVAMIASVGRESSLGPPQTWLYQVQGRRLNFLFHYPLEAT